MLFTNIAISLLSVASIAEAQGIHFGQVLKKKPSLATTTNTKPKPTNTKAIAESITSHLKAIKPTATPTPKAGTPGARPGVHIVDNTCSAQPVRYSYVPSPNTPPGFIADSGLATTARNNAMYPAGYVNVFSNQYGAMFANNYMDSSDLSTYNTSACAALCDSRAGCLSFNIYFERQPTLLPGTACPNPTALTGIRCAIYGSYISLSQATNVGQWRSDFMVVIQGSNGWNKLAAPTAVTGFNSTPLAGAVDTSSVLVASPYLVSQFFTGTTATQSCADLCVSVTLANKRAAQASLRTSYTPCNYFNTFDVSVNGASQGLYCQLYSRDVSALAGLYKANYNGVDYDLLKSTGYALSTVDTGRI